MNVNSKQPGSQSSESPWVPDQGDGTYRNPIIHADYSDPDVVRVGDDYYLTASSFNCTPGLPILHSRDLVNWTIVNYALKKLPDSRYNEVCPGEGVWAPAIRYHAGLFWIVFPTPDEGIYVTTAKDPEDTWSEPYQLLPGKGIIDPCPFWDDDGQAYLIHAYAGSRAGIRNKLRIRPMTYDGRCVKGEGRVIAEIPQHLPALEGPKIYKRNGWYYISAPSGGVAMGWQVIFRSRSIYGPYEEKIVLAQNGTSVNGPHQGALVDTQEGEWWFIHFQDEGLYGRIVHLQPVRWDNDWPLIGIDQDKNGIGQPVLHYRKPKVSVPCQIVEPQTSDDFTSPDLSLQWQWQANFEEVWYSLSERSGYLRLFSKFMPQSNFLKAPNLLLQKFPARKFMVETEVDFPRAAEEIHAGVIVCGEEYAALDIQKTDDGYCLRLLTIPEQKGLEWIKSSVPLKLCVIVSEGGFCRFGIVKENDGFYQIGPAFQAKPGRWIGAKIGIYCLSSDPVQDCGYADFSYFRVTAIKSQPDELSSVIRIPMGGNLLAKQRLVCRK